MPRKSQLSAETINQIRELYKRGFKLLEISRKLGVQKWQVLRYTDDLPRQIRRLTTEEKEEIRKLFNEGTDILELAKMFGIHRQTVYLLTYDLRGSVRRFGSTPIMEVLSELTDKGYFIVPKKKHSYLRAVRSLTSQLNIRRVRLFKGKFCVTVCFLQDKNGEALKEVLKLMKKKTTSYQELNYLSQVFGIKLKAVEKRNTVNTTIKEISQVSKV